MKFPDSGHEERMLACGVSWTLDGQAGMSKEGDSPDYEYWRDVYQRQVMFFVLRKYQEVPINE